MQTNFTSVTKDNGSGLVKDSSKIRLPEIQLLIIQRVEKKEAPNT